MEVGKLCGHTLGETTADIQWEKPQLTYKETKFGRTTAEHTLN